MITLNCPHCSQPLQIPEEYAGQTGGCRHCKQTFTVPVLPEYRAVAPSAGTSPKAGSNGHSIMPFTIGAFIVVLIMGAYLLGKGGASTEPTPSTAGVNTQDAVSNPLVDEPTLSPKDLLQQVNTLAAAEKYQDALETFEAVRAKYPAAIESIDALNVAAIYLQLGDHTKHEALCRWMFEQFPGNKKTVDAERTGKAYVIRADADDTALLAEATIRIDYFVQTEKNAMVQWGRVSQGIAAYRQKRYQDALEILEKEVVNDTPAIQSLALAYAAMVEYALENEAKSLAHLADARVAVAKLPIPGTKSYTQWWANVLISKLALAEAEKVLGQPAEAPPIAAQSRPKSKSPKAQREQALQLAREGDYRAAVDALEEVRATQEALITSHDAVIFGIVYSLLEDQPGHEKFARWVLDLFAATTDPFDAEHAAKTYLVYPGARDTSLLEKSLKLAQIGVDNTDPKNKGRAWIYLTQAMAKYRAGAHEDADTWIQKTLENTDIPSIKTLAMAYSALNEISAGNAAGAAETLQEAKKIAGDIPEDAWEHLHHAEIVFSEADSALGARTE